MGHPAEPVGPRTHAWGVEFRFWRSTRRAPLRRFGGRGHRGLRARPGILLQLGAGPFAEELLLGVAHAYEQATPWHTRRTPGLEG
jgi:hypothetical protein